MRVSVRELIDRGKWEEICRAKQIDPWTYNSGVLSEATIELTDEEGLRFSLWATSTAQPSGSDEACPALHLNPYPLPPSPEASS